MKKEYDLKKLRRRPGKARTDPGCRQGSGEHSPRRRGSRSAAYRGSEVGDPSPDIYRQHPSSVCPSRADRSKVCQLERVAQARFLRSFPPIGHTSVREALGSSQLIKRVDGGTRIHSR